MITIRKARKADVHHVLVLAKELYESDKMFLPERLLKYTDLKAGSESVFRKRLLGYIGAREEVLLVAEVDGAVVGYAQAIVNMPKNPLMTSRKTGEVENIIVAKSHRRKGVMAALFKGLDDWFIKQGCELVELEVIPSNPAKKIYHKMGFTTVKEMLRKNVKR